MTIDACRNGVTVKTGNGSFTFDGATAANDAAEFIKAYLIKWATLNGDSYVADPIAGLGDDRIIPT